MSSKPTWSKTRALIGAVCLFGGGSMVFVIVVVMFRNSLHSSTLWLFAFLLSLLALYGLWVLRMAFPAARPDGKEGEKAAKATEGQAAQPTKSGKLEPGESRLASGTA